ncbi:MAG: glycosyltransferase family 2 protein, partial [Bacteroidales bacterium]|nr:glycosyltransferase family 2 protein [Bacteroidales bacterium]
MKPVASFIVPAYNESQNIKFCIDSLLLQTEANFEVIVIDDGSTDNTFEIVKSIHDPRIKIFRQKNRGRVAARNRALQLSKGKYIILQDADDWAEPDRLRKQLAMAESITNGMPVIGTGFELHKEGKPRTYRKLFPKNNIEIRKIMSRPIFAGTFHPPTMLALRQHILNY